MRRREIAIPFLAIIAIAATGCQGFTIHTLARRPNPFGPPTIVDQPSVRVVGRHQADLSGASGSQTFFRDMTGNNSRLNLPEARVPARWAFLSDDLRCIGISPPLVNVGKGATVDLLCLTLSAAAATEANVPTIYSLD